MWHRRANVFGLEGSLGTWSSANQHLASSLLNQTLEITHLDGISQSISNPELATDSSSVASAILTNVTPDPKTGFYM